MVTSEPGAPLRSAVDARTLDALQQAVDAFNSGRWEDAERKAREVLAIRPGDPSALNVLAGAAMNTGRCDEAIALFERASAGQPKNPFIAFNLAEAHRRNHEAAAAIREFKRAIRLKPDFAEAHTQLGETLRGAGREAEAASAYRTALRLKPTLAQALAGLGLLLQRGGDLAQAVRLFDQARVQAETPTIRAAICAHLAGACLQAGEQPKALDALSEAVGLAPETPTYWRALAGSLRNTKVVPSTPRFRTQLLALFERDDVNPRALATAALAVLKSAPDFGSLLDRIAERPPCADDIVAGAPEAAAALLRDPLFQALLVNAPVPDVPVELLLTCLRRDLLRDLADEAGGGADDDLQLVCALARQCHLNEYVYCVSDDEKRTLDRLLAELGRRNGRDQRPDWLGLAMIACYVSLDRTPARGLDLSSAPEPFQLIVQEQIGEPREERLWRDRLQALRPPRDDVSKAVQDQYEENPYPRWTRCHLGEPLPFRAAVRAALPHLHDKELPDIDAPHVLVAGCGTGLETMHVVNAYRGATIVALDLSRASLAYGMRKLFEYGVTTVRHVHGDMLDVERLEERFDLIESFGVLHHMRDPEQGLARLIHGAAEDALADVA